MIAHILRKYDPKEWAGKETAVRDLIASLNREFPFKLFCPELPSAERGPFEELGIPIERVKSFLPVLSFSQEKRNKLIQIGGNLMSFQLLQKLQKEKELQLIHLHTLGLFGGIGRSVAKKRNIPLVVSLHGGVFDLPPDFIRYFREQMRGCLSYAKLFSPFLKPHNVLREADAIITFNKEEKRILEKKYPDRRIIHLPHGIEAAVYEKDCRQKAAEAFPQLREKKLALVVARIDPVKNQLWLIDQLPEMLKKVPDLVLGFAGPCTNDDYMKKLKKRTRELDLEGKVFFLGMLPPGDPRLVGLYQSAWITVLPSIAEPFGLVILESWASGTPVIASAASGPRDIIRQGENGFLFELNKPEGFHQALQELGNRETRERIIAESRKDLHGTYTIEASAQEVGKLYRELLL